MVFAKVKVGYIGYAYLLGLLPLMNLQYKQIDFLANLCILLHKMFNPAYLAILMLLLFEYPYLDQVVWKALNYLHTKAFADLAGTS